MHCTLLLANLLLGASGIDARGDVPASFAAVDHQGQVTAQEILWQTTVVGAGPGLLRLATPLPAQDLTVRGGDPHVQGELLLGVWQSGGAIVHLQRRQSREPGATVRLDAPLLAGDAVQRVVLTGGDGLRFVPAKDTGLVLHLGSMRSAVVDRDARESADQWLGGRPRNAIYLRSPPPGGIRGALTGTADRQPWLLGALAGAAGLLIGLGALVMARLSRRAGLERAWEALDKVDAERDAT